MEKLEPSHVAGRNVSGAASWENRQLLKMFNVQPPCDSKFHSCRSIPKKPENIHAQTKTSEHKCSKQHVRKSQKLETTPMSIY